MESNSRPGLSFGQVAAEYDRLRPSYPAEAFRWISARVTGRRAVEFGAGTGKATRELVNSGFEVTAVEPDPEMAALGWERVPQAEWRVVDAAGWVANGEQFDLAIGAQVWHWVPQSVDAVVAGALTPDGAMVWMWNHPETGPEKSLFGDLYARYLPETAASNRRRLHRLDQEHWRERMEQALGNVEVFEVLWSRHLSAADYVALTGTYSDHIALEPGDRTALQQSIYDRLMETGGTIDVDYSTRVYIGRRG